MVALGVEGALEAEARPAMLLPPEGLRSCEPELLLLRPANGLTSAVVEAGRVGDAPTALERPCGHSQRETETRDAH